MQLASRLSSVQLAALVVHVWKTALKTHPQKENVMLVLQYSKQMITV